MGSRCLLVTIVRGNSRLAVPPARTSPFMAAHASTRARAQRDLRLWCGRVAGNLAFGDRAAGAAGDRLLIRGWQAALVVRDDQCELERIELRRRGEERGLDDGVRVPLDVHHRADDEALRVWRPDPGVD